MRQLSIGLIGQVNILRTAPKRAGSIVGLSCPQGAKLQQANFASRELVATALTVP
jgi:hypothetical protein